MFKTNGRQKWIKTKAYGLVSAIVLTTMLGVATVSSNNVIVRANEVTLSTNQTGAITIENSNSKNGQTIGNNESSVVDTYLTISGANANYSGSYMLFKIQNGAPLKDKGLNIAAVDGATSETYVEGNDLFIKYTLQNTTGGSYYNFVFDYSNVGNIFNGGDSVTVSGGMYDNTGALIKGIADTTTSYSSKTLEASMLNDGADPFIISEDLNTDSTLDRNGKLTYKLFIGPSGKSVDYGNSLLTGGYTSSGENIDGASKLVYKVNKVEGLQLHPDAIANGWREEGNHYVLEVTSTSVPREISFELSDLSTSNPVLNSIGNAVNYTDFNLTIDVYDEDGNDLSGYVLIRTYTDKNGDIVNEYRKVVTKWVDKETGKEILESKDGEHPDKDGNDVEGYEFVRTSTDENGDLINEYVKIKTPLKEEPKVETPSKVTPTPAQTPAPTTQKVVSTPKTSTSVDAGAIGAISASLISGLSLLGLRKRKKD